MSVGSLLLLSCPFKNCPFQPVLRPFQGWGWASFQRILEKPQTRARCFCRESCLPDASENEASLPGDGTSPLHPALGVRPARLTPPAAGLGSAHNGSWTRRAHSTRLPPHTKMCSKNSAFSSGEGEKLQGKMQMHQEPKKSWLFSPQPR